MYVCMYVCMYCVCGLYVRIKSECWRQSQFVSMPYRTDCNTGPIFVNHETFHKLTLPKSTEKCWLEWDLNSHLWDTGLPVYLLSYWVHRDCVSICMFFSFLMSFRNMCILVLFRTFFKRCISKVSLRKKMNGINSKNVLKRTSF